jgi:MFS transporter, OPA family, glycerol-3-phosphate transporter
MSRDMERSTPPERDWGPHGTNQIVWTIWLTYGAFYFCRTNLAVALPGIEEEYGYDKVEMSVVLLSLKITYGIGQFLNGQLAERLSPRVMLAIGMIGSAALNVAFGFGTALYFFLFVWAMNGYCQSLGWTPCVRVLGNWVPVRHRGWAMGIVGTGYQLTAGLTFIVAGVAVSWFGWRGAVWGPPAILFAAALAMLVLLRDSPPDGNSNSTGQVNRKLDRHRRSFATNLKLTLTNSALWLLALSLGMLNACRYGFIDWGVSHLYSVEKARLQLDTVRMVENNAALLDAAVLSSAVKYAVLPIGGIMGSLWAGWASDRYFGSRRAPVICGLLIVLGCLTLAYDSVARASFVGTLLMLLAIGFTIFGPQVLLVGTAPADLAKEGTAAAAAGFVNCMGYFGAAVLGDLLTGHLAEYYGWNVAIFMWAAWAFLAAALVAVLWNRTGEGVRQVALQEANTSEQTR